MNEYIQICKNYGFLHGAVSMSYNHFEGPDQDQPRTLLGITWHPKEDTYTPNTEWNISRKVRGTYKECSLKQMTDVDIENIQVTRTLISRLLGQTHEPLEKNYSGVIMYLKVLGRKANSITTKWNQIIDDPDLKSDLVKLLKHLRDFPMTAQPRAVIPDKYNLKQLNLSGDGSEPGASATLHALSESLTQPADLVSRLVMAAQKLGSFSIPIHELLGMLQGLKLAEEYIVAIPSLSSLPDTLLLNVFLDSMCSASTLSPHKVHKSTAPRNLTTKIMRVSKAIVTSAPKIQIYFSHLQSSSLPADLNSKAMDNPLQISSSELWRSGPIEYFRTTPPANWFLKVTCDS